ncbi:MAG: tetratricopeptide repeat protein [Candidatus Scalindua sp.]|nr:tetratricopeptide repeat protein [Candidatus Scalindua sp.]
MDTHTRPKLSICIPTFNRAGLLNETLNTLDFACKLPIEIIVSDNASTDNTEKVVCDWMDKLPNIKYVRQKSNNGGMINYSAPFRLALGEFSIWLADDDRIDIDSLWELVELLESTPDVVACFTGWYEWDNCRQKPLVHWSPIKEVSYFDNRQGTQLFDFMVRNNIFPEVGVYRTEVINRVRFQLHKTWSFHWWMWNYLRYGRICFHSNVFYKNTLIFSSGKPNKNREGNIMSVELIDEYRAGAESVLFGAMIENACLPVPKDQRTQAMQMVNKMINTRLEVAGRLSRGQQDFIASYEFYSRFMLWQELRGSTIADLEKAIAPNAVVQALIELFEQTPDTEEISICSFRDPDLIVKKFRSMRDNLPVHVRSIDEILSDVSGKRIIVVEQARSVSTFVSAGIPSGRVYSFEETYECFRMQPKNRVKSDANSHMNNKENEGKLMNNKENEGKLTVSAMTTQAISCYQTGDFTNTQRHAESILRADSGPSEKAVCHQLLGLIAHRRMQYDVAEEHLKQAVKLRPDVPELRKDLSAAYTAQARRLRKQSKLAESELQVREALQHQPDNPDAHNVLGVVLQEQDRLEEARQCFQHALTTSPKHAQLRLNYANLLSELHETDAAVEEYKEALDLRPDHLKTLLNAGATLVEAKRSQPAIQLLERALQLDSDNAEVRFNLGIAYVNTGQIAAATEQFEHALRLRPSWSLARANWLRHRAEICDWRDDWNSQLQTLLNELASELEAGRQSPVSVSLSTSIPIPASTMRKITCRHTELLRNQLKSRSIHSPRHTSTVCEHDRLRIGYLSQDFRDHAIGHLMRSMFGHHDRSKFEIFTYSLGTDDGSDYRRNIQEESEHFLDISDRRDTEIVEQITSDAIDILVDIGGYTKDCRPDVLLARPAPVLVHYLGFPGTLGGLVDYFVTDPVLTPHGSQLRDEFEESLIYLQHTYQMTDNKQPIADLSLTHQQCGLPSKGFIFASFTNNYKIQPEIFDVWMRILKAVPDSVLWLLKSQPEVVGNLQSEAQRRGVGPERLVFGDKVAKPEHLARCQLANLCLDTTVYGAHSTTTDSLWAGVPVITCPGQRFAERVAASLLTAAGLEKLIVNDLAEYEQLAIKLATNPRFYKKVHKDWSRRRTTSQLFDTGERVRQLELAYDTIWKRHCADLPPQDIMI